MLKYGVEGKGKGKDRGGFVLSLKVTDQRTKEALLRNKDNKDPKITFNFESRELEIDGSTFLFTCQEEKLLECYALKVNEKDKSKELQFVGDVTSKFLMKVGGRNFEETINKTKTDNESSSHSTELIGSRPTPKKRKNSMEQDPNKRQKLAVDKDLRTKTIQLLAIEPLEIGEMVTALETTKELLKPVLTEIAFANKEGKQNLKQSCWKDIQIYSWKPYTDAQRAIVAENARKAFEKAGLPSTAPQWKLLRPPKTPATMAVNPRAAAGNSPSTPSTSTPATPSSTPITPVTPAVSATPATPATPIVLADIPTPTTKVRISLKEKSLAKPEAVSPAPSSQQNPEEKAEQKPAAPKIKLTLPKSTADQKAICAIQSTQQFQDYSQRFHNLYPVYKKLLEEHSAFKEMVSKLQDELSKALGTTEESSLKKKIAESHSEWQKSGKKQKLIDITDQLSAIKTRMKEYATSAGHSK